MEKKEMKRMLVKAIVFEESRSINETLPVVTKGENFPIMFCDSFTKLKEFLDSVDSSYEDMIGQARETLNEIMSELVPNTLMKDVNNNGTFIVSASSAIALQMHALGRIATTIEVYMHSFTNNLYYCEDYTRLCKDPDDVTAIDLINEGFPEKYYQDKEAFNKKLDELADYIFPNEDLHNNIIIEKLYKMVDRVYRVGNPDSETNIVGRKFIGKILELPVIHRNINTFGNSNLVAVMCEGVANVFEGMFPEESIEGLNDKVVKEYMPYIIKIVNDMCYSYDYISGIVKLLADETNSAHLEDGEFVYNQDKVESNEEIMATLFDYTYEYMNARLVLDGHKAVNFRLDTGIPKDVDIFNPKLSAVFRSRGILLLKSTLDYIGSSSKHSQAEIRDNGMETENNLKELMKEVMSKVEAFRAGRGELNNDEEEKVPHIAKKTKLFN